MKVVSSNIDEVEYSEGVLVVTFRNGGTYAYEDVPKQVYDSLVNADSVGRYFHGAIKGKYAYTKIH